MNKAMAFNKKCILFVLAFVLTTALAFGAVNFGGFVKASADGDDAPVAVADQDGRVLYYVDCGYLTKNDDTLGDRNEWGAPYGKQTPYMVQNELYFGTQAGDKTKLYNSVTDKNLYPIESGAYNFEKIQADDNTGKYWGTYTEGEGEYHWEWYRRGKTNGSTPGFESGRYINEGNQNDPHPLVYKFEVDDITTPLKITVGARRVVSGGQAGNNNAKLKINDLATVDYVCQDEDRVYTFSEGIHGVSETLSGTDEAKPYVTLRFGEDGKIAHVAYIRIETVRNFTDAQKVVKKSDTSFTAKSVYDTVENATVNFTEDQLETIAEAEDYSTVNINATVNGLARSYTMGVIPDDVVYFVNCGEADTAYAYADIAYDATAGYGYTDGMKGSNSSVGVPQYVGDAFTQSCRTETTTLNYKFTDLEQGSYGVVVGIAEHWAQWMSHARAHKIKANNGTVVDLNGPEAEYKGGGTASNPDVNGHTAKATCYGDVGADGELTVNIASTDESVPTYISVYPVNKVTYDTQGGSEVNAVYFDKGTTVTLTATAPVYADHEFKGWFAAAEGGEAITTVNAGGTVYAQWTACEYEADWAWTEYTAATLTLTCKHEGCEHSKSADAAITSAETPADCEHGAGTTYTATATVDGTDYTDKKVVSTGEALGHTGGTATCTAKAVCTRCDEEYGELAAHTPAVDAAVSATCTTAGKTEGSHCSVCNTVITAQTEIAATGHTGGTATCTAKAQCTVCNEEYGELAAHNYSEGKCTVCEAADPDYTAPGTTTPGTGDNDNENQGGTEPAPDDGEEEDGGSGKKKCGSAAVGSSVIFAIMAMLASGAVVFAKKAKKA